MTDIELVVTEGRVPDTQSFYVELGIPLLKVERRDGANYSILTPRLASLEELDEQIARITEQLSELRHVAGFYFKKR